MSLTLISDISQVSGESALRGAPNQVSAPRACRVWRSVYISDGGEETSGSEEAHVFLALKLRPGWSLKQVTGQW